MAIRERGVNTAGIFEPPNISVTFSTNATVSKCEISRKCHLMLKRHVVMIQSEEIESLNYLKLDTDCRMLRTMHFPKKVIE